MFLQLLCAQLDYAWPTSLNFKAIGNKHHAKGHICPIRRVEPRHAYVFIHFDFIHFEDFMVVGGPALESYVAYVASAARSDAVNMCVVKYHCKL